LAPEESRETLSFLGWQSRTNFRCALNESKQKIIPAERKDPGQSRLIGMDTFGLQKYRRKKMVDISKRSERDEDQKN